MESLTSPTVAVMVSRAYADRVRDKLQNAKVDWQQLHQDSDPSVSRKRPLSSSCRTIETPHVKGGRKNRRGYTLLVIEGVPLAALVELPPMARQNISFAMVLSHCSKMEGQATQENHFELLWSLLQEQGYGSSSHLLRVECFPKEDCEKICLGLQQAAASNAQSSTDPSEDAVAMTRSASKCSHVLNVISDSDGTVWAGVVTGKAFSSVHLNDTAAKQITIESTDPQTGENVVKAGSSTIIGPHVPVSRAYYKLNQVWDEILSPLLLDDSIAGTAAVDLGAAPGGWTQVLSTQRFSRVVAVDPGALAKRIFLDEKRIQHVVAELSSEQTAAALLQVVDNTGSQQKLSLLVCDASTDSNEILDKILQLLKRLNGPSTSSWSLPCAWVVTLKLPYKTVGSLDRNLGLVLKTIPQHLSDATQLMFGKNADSISIKFKIVHLMANSESERTLVAVFEEK